MCLFVWTLFEQERHTRIFLETEAAEISVQSSSSADQEVRKQPLKKTLSETPSLQSINSFKSAKSYKSNGSGDFYSVCSEDSYQTINLEKQ